MAPHQISGFNTDDRNTAQSNDIKRISVYTQCINDKIGTLSNVLVDEQSTVVDYNYEEKVRRVYSCAALESLTYDRNLYNYVQDSQLI